MPDYGGKEAEIRFKFASRGALILGARTSSEQRSIGTVKDLIIDPQGYVLTDLVVKMQKDASRRIFGKRFTLHGAKVRVPMPTVEKMGESILLKYGVDQLEQHVQRL